MSGGGGSWKVAYADFVTAMMAFFLLMWILNMSTKETLVELQGYFQAEGGYGTNDLKKINAPPLATIAAADVETYKPSDVGKTNMEIAQKLGELLQSEQGDGIGEGPDSITASESGVLMRVTGNVMFEPNGVDLSEAGKRVLDKVISVMTTYNVYLMVRGHTSSREDGKPNFPSKWELSSARASVAVRYILGNSKLTPYSIMAVAYADTRPLLPDGVDGDAPQNRRIEFYFYKPENKMGIMGF